MNSASVIKCLNQVSLLTLLTIFLSAGNSSVYGAKTKYAVKDIPDSLVIDAKTVVRLNQRAFTLNSLTNVTLEETYAITVYDRSADEDAAKAFFYDKDRKVVNLLATYYNAEGEVTSRLSKRDFKDVSYDQFGSVYDDTRVLYHNPGSNHYPYTIEYFVSFQYNNSYSFPNWYPLQAYDQSLQYGSCKVVLPIDYELNYKANQLADAKIIESGKTKSFIWEASNFPAIERESYALPFTKQCPILYLSPSEFEYDGYKGSFTSWKEYGQFINQLNDGRNDLSPEFRQKISALVEGITDDKEKARILYKFLQDNTRYVSIQVGIGGLQPFPASIVEKYGYGDCKALTNYMKTLLEAVGIKSYYSLVEAGKAKYSFDTSFVHDPFNHIILYLPLDGEEIWLECTSQEIPFGFLGDFTDNRLALVIKEDGGQLTKTPSYCREKSISNTVADVLIAEDGMAKADVRSKFTGLDYDNILSMMTMDYERQKDYLYKKRIDIPDFIIKSFEYHDYPDLFPTAEENLNLELINYATKSGKRIFVPVNLMNRIDDAPRTDKNRKTAFYLSRDYIRYDTIRFTLPVGYSFESIPEDITLESSFGNYRSQLQADGNSLLYIRHSDIKEGIYPPEEYNDFVSFLKNISKADKQKIVLLRNEI